MALSSAINAAATSAFHGSVIHQDLELVDQAVGRIYTTETKVPSTIHIAIFTGPGVKM